MQNASNVCQSLYVGTISPQHPCLAAAIEAFLLDENHFVAEHNAWCAEERGQLAGVRVVRDAPVTVG